MQTAREARTFFSREENCLQAALIAVFVLSYLQASGGECFSRVRPVDRRKHL
jgi:hypothetical protein